MHAWVKKAEGLSLTEAPLPTPHSDELLVRVEAVSLNRGEVRTVAHAKDGSIPGWDLAGVVERTASDGTGPAAGQRVAAIVTRGAWAELAAVPVRQAATVPDDVESRVAATLPIAGLTALRAFDVGGPLLASRVLITGASGGVGMLAIQIARLGGATVTGVVGSPERAIEVRELGADAVVASIDETKEEFDLILESVGGESLAQAIARLAPGGTVVTIGNSSESETLFNARTLFGKGGATIYGLLIFDEVARRRIGAKELASLLDLVATGRLVTPVHVERSWRDLPNVIADLEQRRFTGKAVLTFD